MAIRRRNSALQIFTSGKRGESLEQLSTRVGRVVSDYDRAQQRAVASLKRKAQPIAKRHILKTYGIKSSKLNGTLRVETGVKHRSGVLSIWASTRQLPLIHFQGKWGGRLTAGATAVIVLGKTKVYDGAFIANVGWRGTSGKSIKADTIRRGIYERTFKGGKRVGRGPLRQLHGPSPFEMITPVSHVGLRIQITDELRDFYVNELIRQYRLEAAR